MIPDIARTAARWQHVTDDLAALARGILAERWELPSACDGWTNRELLIHLATGYVARIERLESILAGRAPAGIDDIDSINAHNVASLHTFAIDAIIEVMVETRGRVLLLIERLRPEHVQSEYLSAAALDELSAHDLEHAAQLECALA